ncbi:MAG: hypothetical protein ACRDGR_05770, partial [bacterium]
MRVLQTLLVTASLVLALAGFSSACTIESATVTGKFTENGFEVASALDANGNAIDKLQGKTFTKVETAENVVLPASAQGQLVVLVADLDFEQGLMRVASTDAAVASVKAAGSGKGCCAAKAAAAASATQSASVA